MQLETKKQIYVSSLKHDYYSRTTFVKELNSSKYKIGLWLPIHACIKCSLSLYSTVYPEELFNTVVLK